MENNILFNKCISFITSVHRVTHELAKNSKPDSITPIQYKILEYITVNRPVTPSEISDCQHLSMPNTSRELKKLSEKNLIKKISDTADRRKQYIRLTEEGEAMMCVTFKSLESLFLSRLQNASKEDLQDIEHSIDILNTRLFF